MQLTGWLEGHDLKQKGIRTPCSLPLGEKGITHLQIMYMPVISQAVNLPCTDPYLWNTVIPRHNNDLNKHNTETQADINSKV